MTFCICLFIVIMQFLWRYIDELVGKGLSMDLIAELFFHAALSLLPMALPLSILLGALFACLRLAVLYCFDYHQLMVQ